jgi:hypothetical protein
VKPLARADVIVRPVGDEVVVYDPATHKAHCLNRTAAAVFAAADGRTRVGGLAARLASSAKGVEVPEDVVWTAIEQLSQAGLLESPWPGRPGAAPVTSRRQALRAVGLVAALAPVVVSLAVPTPAEAANTCIPATACTTSNFGQPCYVLSQAECASKICTGTAGDCQ